jgi:hypothetical protein
VKVFFDLDPAVYMAGFAAEKKEYNIVFETEYGVEEKFFLDGNKKNAWKREISSEEYEGPAIDILDEECIHTVQDEGFARQAASTIVKTALREIRRRFKTNDLDVQFFLTGKGNFREDVATIKEYKGNRKETPKPVHYQAVRDYLVDSWGAVVVEGKEADDEVSIRAWKEYRDNNDDYVVATIDKDLDQIPGWHLDYKKHAWYDVDALDGELFFYAQVLAGDATDNIQGCYRIGIGKAKKLVDEWFSTCVESGHQEWRRYMWDRIVETYAQNKLKYPEKYPEGMTAAAAAHENAQLVYMQQNEDETWNPENK